MPKKKKAAKKPAQKKAPKKPAPRTSLKGPSEKAAPSPERPKKIDVTPELKRIWLRVRNAYSTSQEAFSYSLSVLDDRQANKLYDFAVAALYKGNAAEILRAHPELKGLVRTDDDRLCMHDTYENLSWRLHRREPMPKDLEVTVKFRLATRGRITPEVRKKYPR